MFPNGSSTLTTVSITGYTTIFLISLIGNLIVSIITVRKGNGRRPTDILIFALAICDLVITVNIPFTAISIIYPFFLFGSTGCKLLFGLRNTAVYASSFILLFISLERCYATFDLSRSRRDLRITIGLVSICVIIALGLTIPQFTVLQLTTIQNDSIRCAEIWNIDFNISRKAYSILLIIVTFAIPFITITICNIVMCYKLFYVKSKSTTNQIRLKARRRVVAVMIAVSAVFFICLLPIYLVDTLNDFRAIEFTPSLSAVTYAFTWIAYSHSMWNPIIYIIGSSDMRKSCKALLKIDQCNCIIRNKIDRNVHSKQNGKMIGTVLLINRIVPLQHTTLANDLTPVK